MTTTNGCAPLNEAEREALLCDCGGEADGAHGDVCAAVGNHGVELESNELAARVEQLLAKREAELLDPRHIVAFNADGWSLQHPASCRPNLLECNIHKNLTHLDGLPTTTIKHDRYVVHHDDEGHVTSYEPLVGL